MVDFGDTPDNYDLDAAFGKLIDEETGNGLDPLTAAEVERYDIESKTRMTNVCEVLSRHAVTGLEEATECLELAYGAPDQLKDYDHPGFDRLQRIQLLEIRIFLYHNAAEGTEVESLQSILDVVDLDDPEWKQWLGAIEEMTNRKLFPDDMPDETIRAAILFAQDQNEAEIDHAMYEHRLIRRVGKILGETIGCEAGFRDSTPQLGRYLAAVAFENNYPTRIPHTKLHGGSSLLEQSGISAESAASYTDYAHILIRMIRSEIEP